MGSFLCRCWIKKEDSKEVFRTNSIHPHRANTRRRKKLTVLDTPTPNLLQNYQMGRVLGKGQSGETRSCMKKSTGKKYACKSIYKNRLDASYIRQEIKVLQKLSGHPNIVELEDVFEDEKCVHLVMELCTGGDLFHDFMRRKTYSEEEAAQVCKVVMEVVSFCQSHGFMHRDIKLENILLASSAVVSSRHDVKIAYSNLKVADFGLAVPFQRGDYFSNLAGSAYYVAPEVLDRRYGPEIDVWSAGVLLYIMLSGKAPFWDDTEEGIFEAIRHGVLDLDKDPWPKRSKAVKNLIRGMLCKDVKHRLSPQQVLNHEWVVMHTEFSDLSLSSSGEKEALLSNCCSDNSLKSSSSEAFSN